MPTVKQRINITVDKNTDWVLKTLAKRDNVSVSTKVMELVENALELEEDLALAAIADARSNKNAKYISFEKAWKNIK